MNRENLLSKNQKSVLKKLVNFFEKEKIKYAISGGLSSIIYGASNRKLFDIDLAIDTRGLKISAKHFRKYKVSEQTINQRKDLENFDINLLALKINNVLIDIAEDKSAYMITKKGKKKIPIIINDAKTLLFAGVKLKIRPPEELILQKLYIGRKTDINDAKSILLNNKIDIDYLKKRSKKINIWNSLKRKLKIIID